MVSAYKFILAILLLSVGSCYQDEIKSVPQDSSKSIRFEGKFPLKVREPSGLTFQKSENLLLTVSDETDKVYVITPKGETVDSLGVNAGDLEGISFITENKLAVVSERTGEIIEIDLSGRELERFKPRLDFKKNKGLEGISYSPTNKSFFLLQEKEPRLLLISNYDFTKLDTFKLDFASDFSGIFCDSTRNELWIISDEDKLVVRCDLTGKVLDKYHVDIPKIEGVAMNIEDRMLYLISDKTEYLYVYKIK